MTAHAAQKLVHCLETSVRESRRRSLAKKRETLAQRLQCASVHRTTETTELGGHKLESSQRPAFTLRCHLRGTSNWSRTSSPRAPDHRRWRSGSSSTQVPHCGLPRSSWLRGCSLVQPWSGNFWTLGTRTTALGSTSGTRKCHGPPAKGTTGYADPATQTLVGAPWRCCLESSGAVSPAKQRC